VTVQNGSGRPAPGKEGKRRPEGLHGNAEKGS
jgi:hypothetical protein